VTVVARGVRRLAALAAEIRAAGAEPRTIAQDYRDTGALVARLEEALAATGAVDRALLWIHGSAPAAPAAVVALLERTSPGARVVWLFGSAAADPSADVETRLASLGARAIDLRGAILGFAVGSGGSRWLTDEEICAGALAALERDARLRVVGVVRPWSARP
jgi:hypothetical protein